MKTERGLILALASAVRHRPLTEVGVPRRVIPADLDEVPIKIAARTGGKNAAACARELAAAKACAVSRDLTDDWVLDCDQMLEIDGEWLDKPGSVEALRVQLLHLRGRTHALISVICLARNGRTQRQMAARAGLTMRNFSPGFLETHLEAAAPRALHAVGGYSIEGLGTQLFSRIDGNIHAIMGLPLLPLLARLRRIGIIPP